MYMIAILFHKLLSVFPSVCDFNDDGPRLISMSSGGQSSDEFIFVRVVASFKEKEFFFCIDGRKNTAIRPMALITDVP